MTLLTYIKQQTTNSHFRDLLTGSSIALVFKIGGSISTFIFTLLLARTFEAPEAGMYFLVIAFCEILTMVARLGLPQSIIAFVGRYAALKNWPAVKGAFQGSIKYILLSSVLIGIVLTVAIPSIAHLFHSNQNFAAYIRILPLAILPYAFLHLLGNALRGLGHLRNSQFIISFSPQFLQLLGLIIIMHRHSIAAVIWVYVAAGWVTSSLGYLMWRHHTPHMGTIKGDFSSRMIFATAMPLFMTNMLMIINARAGTFALGILAEPAEVLVYNVALRISLLSGFALLAVNAYCAPKFAALHGTGDLNGLGNVARHATFLAIVAALPLILFIFSFPDTVLSIFGPSLKGSRNVMITLVIGQCFNIAAGPVGMLLAMTGHEKKLRNIYLFSTMLNIALQVILIPLFQAGGAAWATTISILAVNLSAIWLVRHVLGISILPNFMLKKIGL